MIESTETRLTFPKERRTPINKIPKSKSTIAKRGSKRLLNAKSIGSHHGASTIKINETENDANKNCVTSNKRGVKAHALKIKNQHTSFNDLKTEKSTNVGKRKIIVSNKNIQLKMSKVERKKDEPIILVKLNNGIMPENNQPLPSDEDNFGIASIEDDLLSELHNDNSAKTVIKDTMNNHINPPKKSITIVSNRKPFCSDPVSKMCLNVDSSDAMDCDQSTTFSDVGYLSSENLVHYLQDEGNSQEPEEELLKYFKDSISSEAKGLFDKDMPQLRLLLEQNLPANNIKPSNRDTGFSEIDSSKNKSVDLQNYPILSPQLSVQQAAQKSPFTSLFHANSYKRRVSFENRPDSFLQSPSTNRKNFSFTPISPRPPTASKASVSISPFVFPRETAFRGKLTMAGTNSHSQPTPVPSTASQGSNQSWLQMSPLKNSSRSTSLSNTPSPIITGRCSSNTMFRGRSTPQDTNLDQTDSVKSSPLMSPSSSSGVFLSPASPMSSCNSPIFTFRKIMSPVKQADDGKLTSKTNPSLLQSLLLTGKFPESKLLIRNERNSDIYKYVSQMEPLAIDVDRFSRKEVTFRSQSVPTQTTIEPISPSSNTLHFPIYHNKDFPPLVELKQNDMDMWDEVLNECKSTVNNIMMDSKAVDMSLNSGSQNVSSKEPVDPVITNLCEFLNIKNISESCEDVKLTHIDRSHPHTQVLYNESSKSSRDPVVSAFHLRSPSKSYPSMTTKAPPQTLNMSGTNYSMAKRNILPLLDTIPAPSFADDIELNLNNLDDLSVCDDAFNELAREVASVNDFK